MGESNMATSSNSGFAGFPGPQILNLVFTGKRLGKGAYATVLEVEWNGTRCAAKRLHDVLLEDDSPGGAERLVSIFATECVTWAKLRHPGIVQFLGVYKEPTASSSLPVLVMERMDTSLWKYLEEHSKEQFPLRLKALILRQVSQALAFLHNQDPPVVHHDLSGNNVLLNIIALEAKVSDFGMSRAVQQSSRNPTSIKGTQVFMPPEALEKVPKYGTSLDVFSFGNLVISTVTHEWPNPESSTKYDGDQLIALNELERRTHHIELFSAEEKQLFQHMVSQCLENRPDRRPSSVMLVQKLRDIESALMVCDDVDPAEVRMRLLAKEEECRRKEEALRVKDEEIRKKGEALREKDEALRQKDEVIEEKDEEIRQKEEALSEKDEALRGKDEALQEKAEVLKGKDEVIEEKHEEIRQKDEALSMKVEELRTKDTMIESLRESIDALREEPILNCLQPLDDQAAAQKEKRPTRNWKELGTCRKVIQHNPGGDLYKAVAVNGDGLLAVVDAGKRVIHLVPKKGMVKSIGRGKLGNVLAAFFRNDWFGISFDLKGNVCTTTQNSVIKLSQDDELLQTISYAGRQCDLLKCPWGVCVSPEGLLYICDHDNHSVTVHNEDGRFLHAFGVRGTRPGCFNGPRDVAFGSDGFVYVTDEGRKVSVWSKEGDFQREFKTKHDPFYITATGDNHLLMTSRWSRTVMVYTLEGELVHEFGQKGSELGKFDEPLGICIDNNGLVYVADCGNKRVQVF